MRVVFSKKSRDDLTAITDYIALDSPKVAVAFTRELRRICEGLGSLPLGYEIVRLPHVENVRRRPFRSYSIYYRVTDIVLILHIRHNARETDTLFFSDEGA